MSSINEILAYMPDTGVLATSHFIDLFPLLLTLIPLYMGEVIRSNGASNGMSTPKLNKDMMAVIVPARYNLYFYPSARGLETEPFLYFMDYVL